MNKPDSNASKPFKIPSVNREPRLPDVVGIDLDAITL